MYALAEKMSADIREQGRKARSDNTYVPHLIGVFAQCCRQQKGSVFLTLHTNE